MKNAQDSEIKPTSSWLGDVLLTYNEIPGRHRSPPCEGEDPNLIQRPWAFFAFYFGTRAYLFSSDEGSCYAFSTSNNYCKSLTSYGVIIQSVNKSFLKTPICGASLSRTIYKIAFFLFYMLFFFLILSTLFLIFSGRSTVP